MNRPPQQSQQRSKSREQSQTQPPPPASRVQQPTRRAERAEVQEDTAEHQDVLEAGETVVKAGRNGERNIRLDMTAVWILPNRSAWFTVTTAAGNGLEVTIEQLSYRKRFEGTTSLKTDVLPIAPIGTPGRILIEDTTTGETYEMKWTWVRLGGGGSFWGAIWKFLKKMFVK